MSRFDEEYFWIEEEITNQNDPKAQGLMITKFIMAASHCKSLSNYFSVFTILGALDNKSVKGLKAGWKNVSKEALKVLDKLSPLLDPSKNMKNYRQSIKKVPPKAPRLPFLPMVTKDLRFIADGNSKSVNGLLNFDRLRHLALYASDLQREVAIPYKKLTVDEELSAYLERASLKFKASKDASEGVIDEEEEELVAILKEEISTKDRIMKEQDNRISFLEKQLKEAIERVSALESLLQAASHQSPDVGLSQPLDSSHSSKSTKPSSCDEEIVLKSNRSRLNSHSSVLSKLLEDPSAKDSLTKMAEKLKLREVCNSTNKEEDADDKDDLSSSFHTLFGDGKVQAPTNITEEGNTSVAGSLTRPSLTRPDSLPIQNTSKHVDGLSNEDSVCDTSTFVIKAKPATEIQFLLSQPSSEHLLFDHDEIHSANEKTRLRLSSLQFVQAIQEGECDFQSFCDTIDLTTEERSVLLDSSLSPKKKATLHRIFDPSCLSPGDHEGDDLLSSLSSDLDASPGQLSPNEHSSYLHYYSICSTSRTMRKHGSYSRATSLVNQVALSPSREHVVDYGDGDEKGEEQVNDNNDSSEEPRSSVFVEEDDIDSDSYGLRPMRVLDLSQQCGNTRDQDETIESHKNASTTLNRSHLDLNESPKPSFIAKKSLDITSNNIKDGRRSLSLAPSPPASPRQSLSVDGNDVAPPKERKMTVTVEDMEGLINKRKSMKMQKIKLDYSMDTPPNSPNASMTQDKGVNISPGKGLNPRSSPRTSHRFSLSTSLTSSHNSNGTNATSPTQHQRRSTHIPVVSSYVDEEEDPRPLPIRQVKGVTPRVTETPHQSRNVSLEDLVSSSACDADISSVNTLSTLDDPSSPAKEKKKRKFFLFNLQSKFNKGQQKATSTESTA